MREPDADFDALRAAWQRLDAPAPQRRLAAEDESARAAVAWMQRAWEALEAPAAHLPLRARRRGASRRFAASMPRLAAAALFLGAALGLALISAAERPGVRSVVVAGGETAPPEAPATPQRPAAPQTTATPASEAPRVERNDQPDRVILRSGPVRLTMLRPATDRAANSPTDNRNDNSSGAVR
ncbi:MAG TPA: hypothetical protein VGC54_13095 [Planctomycetota bacterium]